MSEEDWRRTGQEAYLAEIELEWKRYSKHSEEWDHDHCEFCWVKFMEEPGDEILTEGYNTLDGCRWVCQSCFEDFKEEFNWKVIRESA